MRELVTINVGGAGVNIGSSFLSHIAEEHGITSTGEWKGTNEHQQLQQADVYFTENTSAQTSQRFTPRGVFVDMDPSSLDCFRASPYGKTLRPQNYVYGRSGLCGNFAAGKYGAGADVAYQTVDAIVREVESADSLHGFQVMHSIGSGTGGGFGSSLLMESLRDRYPDRMMMNFCLCPQSLSAANPMEAYSALLSMHFLIENSDATFVFDNEALYRDTQRRRKQQAAGGDGNGSEEGSALINYNDFNKTIASAASNVTASIRFPGLMNTDIRKMALNLIPFPRMHFLQTSLIVPGAAAVERKSASSPRYSSCDVQAVREMFTQSNFLCTLHRSSKSPATSSSDASASTGKGRAMVSSVMLRGPKEAESVSHGEMERSCVKYRNRYSRDFCGWLPTAIQISQCDNVGKVAGQNVSSSATGIINSCGMMHYLKSSTQACEALLKRRCYVHLLEQEGMEQEELKDALSNSQDLAMEYEQYNNADDEYDDEYDDDDAESI